MENLKMFLKDGKSKNIPKGWKLKKVPEGRKKFQTSRRMKNQKQFMKEGKMKNLP